MAPDRLDPVPIIEPAPAKLNLYLHVLGRRADGYHDLDSLVAFADIGDTITVSTESSGPFTLDIDGDQADALVRDPWENNLVWRAATRLSDAVGRRLPARIRLTKRLPVASGIGGGSADAAACLRALCRLWDLSPEDPTVTAVALSLGADVPVCLVGRTARIGGVGDRLALVLGLPASPLVLVNPGVAVPTPAVFGALAGRFSPAGEPLISSADTKALVAQLRSRGNDLTPPALSLAPAIGTVLEALAAWPDCLLSRMSGSGATCFGLFADVDAARRCADDLSARHPSWWVRVSRIRA